MYVWYLFPNTLIVIILELWTNEMVLYMGGVEPWPMRWQDLYVPSPHFYLGSKQRNLDCVSPIILLFPPPSPYCHLKVSGYADNMRSGVLWLRQKHSFELKWGTGLAYVLFTSFMTITVIHVIRMSVLCWIVYHS